VNSAGRFNCTLTSIFPVCDSATQVALLGPPPAHLGGGLAGLVVPGEEVSFARTK
jgi:hypothetical protein